VATGAGGPHGLFSVGLGPAQLHFAMGVMRRLLLVVGLVVLAGCATPSVRPVWTGGSHETLLVSRAPEGFTVSPAEADTIVRQSKILPMKVVYHIYADAQFYYVCDGFFGSGSHAAYRRGVRVDGRTGKIIERAL